MSQKCQYALRAVFELAKRNGQGPVKIADIAEAQGIPRRFLEVILNQLKQGGFVASRRGTEGGYFLVLAPREVVIADIIRLIQGPVGRVGCNESQCKPGCPLYGGCVFLNLWERVGSAITDIYDNTTLEGLMEEDARNAAEYVPGYSI